MLRTQLASPPPPALPATAEERCRVWYAAYGQAVYSYIRFHVSSADVADDVTADSFLKVFRAADRYDASRGEARIWVFGIARNTLRDHLRRERVRRHTSLGAMRDLVFDAPSPEERLLWEEQVGRLLLAVNELNANDREIVGLRYGSELDNAAIAAVLGIGESGVRTRLWRALSRLRTIMDCQPE